MTTTPNLTLPQWDKTDRIMMDDFNAAFANIDDHAVGKDVLLDVTLPESSDTTAEIDVSEIDFPAYRFVIIELYPNDGSISSLECNQYQSNNNMSTQLGVSGYTYKTIVGTPGQYPTVCLMAPMGRTNGPVRCLVLSEWFWLGSTSQTITWGNLNTFYLGVSSAKGQRVRIIGIK